MDEIGLEFAETVTQAENVGWKAQQCNRIKSGGPDAFLPQFSKAGSKRHHLAAQTEGV